MISQKHKTLLNLLADGEFHSGNDLAAALAISRASVCKHLAGLPKWGIHYSAVNGKGYRLERPMELLTSDAILLHIDPENQALIASLEIYDCIESTNSHISQQALNGAPSGIICFAEQQTAGKGRRGRQWVSPFGHNLYFSVLWRFQTSPLTISGLSLAAGVAAIRALHQLYPYQFTLKWPNDIYFQQKKLGGILVEVSGESEGPCTAVIGMGLNVYLPPDEAKSITQAWTDLSSITKVNKNLGRNALAGLLLNQLLPILANFQERGIASYVDEWRSYDCLKGKPATLHIGQYSFNGIVNGIDDQGLLTISRPDGNIQSFASGEVSFSSGG